MKFKRCEECGEEIHTTRDGIEIDHAPECSVDPLKSQLEIYYHETKGEFVIFRRDDPLKPFHPITRGAMIDLQRHLRRYEEDWLSEHNKLQ